MIGQVRKVQRLIVVVTHQRSGSKWFGSVIRQRYATLALGEVFNPDSTELLSFRSYLSKYAVTDLFGISTVSALDRYFDEMRTYLGLYYTFDVMFNQIDWLNFGWRSQGNIIYDYLRSRGDIVVSLVRDARDIYVSMKALEITHQPHLTQLDRLATNEPHRSDARLTLDFDDYQAFRNQLHTDRQALAAAFTGYADYIELHYEDLTANPAAALQPLDQALNRFGESIGQPFAAGFSPFPQLIRSPIDYAQLFANLDEVRDWPR